MKDKKTYEYICIHVDDFMEVRTSAQQIMDKIKSVYTFKLKGPPNYYFATTTKRTKGQLCVGSKNT